MIKLLFETWKLNLYWLLEYRMNFIFQMLGMFFADMTSVIVWIFMFDSMKIVWWIDFYQMLLLYEVILLIFVFSNLFFSWWVNIAPFILSWSLDTYLLLPKKPLFIILSSRTYASLYWDLLMAVVLPFFIKWMTILKFLWIFYLSFIASFALIWTIVAFCSLAFFIWSSTNLSKTYFDLLMWPPHYPPKIFDWTYLKFLFMTVVPVYYIFFLPFNLSMNFNFLDFAILHIASGALFYLGIYVFYKWLSRYESWNLISVNV
ncbi:MAG: hypothetical protein ACD_3C00058G0005 [uncultured bacterium (gcode 4)]|uniref:ABC transporter permease protein n=1 Tax=uncultured bacterium (gcode 4) TaxID=1234023 RepID=K2GDU0_9BACT|nr:MAG: hypothetical protein ACD_3C00058G0005 [uncultured bacterium (gcode 4)]